MLTIRTEAARDKSEVAALWEECFHDSAPFTEWFFTKRWLPDYGVVAVEDGRMVSAMQGWPYTLLIRGKRVKSCMLAGVSTTEACRGRGIMPRCLALFMQSAARRKEPAVFHTPAHHTTFFKCLHYSASNTAFVRAPGDKHTKLPVGATVVPAGETLAQALLPAYGAAMARYSGCVARTEADMALKLADYGSDGGRILYLLDQAGRVGGYAAYLMEEQRLFVEELAATDAAVRDYLLAGLIHEAHGLPVTAKLPPDMAEGLPAGYSAEVLPTGAMGAADVRGLLALLAGFDDVTVDVADHMVPANAGIFAFDGNRSDRAPDVRMDAGRLMQLLNGFYDIDALVELGYAQVENPAVLPLLRKRLPRQTCYVVEEY